MKKIRIALIVLTLALTAKADLMDGDFSIAQTLDDGNTKDPGEIYNLSVWKKSLGLKGWQGRGGGTYVTTAGDCVYPSSRLGSANFRFGQIWTDTLSGSQTLTFDITQLTGSLDDLSLTVEVLGMTQATYDAATDTTSKLDFSNDPVSDGSAWTSLGTVVSFDIDAAGISTGNEIDLDFGSGYAVFAIRMGVDSAGGSTTAAVGFDNMTIGAGGPAPVMGSLVIIK